MKHCGTKRLETERLILRRFVMEDAEAMFQNWASDCEVTKFLTWLTHESVQTSKTVLEDWTAAYKSETSYQWAITLREDERRPIGSIGAVKLDDTVSCVQIGYCLGRPWWHRGIMSEALRAVMDFFFSDVGANRVEARFDPRNLHSGMVMQKCGMQYEGTQRSADRNNQGICDICWYARLKSDR
jgi:ribosomal-protein-alanine N-acetyltransferase